MTVLVTAASSHGATAEIAARIAARLEGLGLEVEVRKPEEVDDVAPFEAVVAGSAVYLGKWLEPATRFVERNAAALAERPTWLFSSGPIVGDPPAPDPHDSAKGEALRESVGAREHRIFGGKLDKGSLSWCERIAVRAAHATEGDHRDWAEIDRWAAAIARELHDVREPTAV